MDAADALQARRHRVQLGEDHAPLVEHGPAGVGRGHGVGLLLDLLAHEVVPSALLGLHRVPLQPAHGALGAGAAAVVDHGPVARQARDVAVLEEDHVARVGDERGRVGGEELLAVGQPEAQRRPVARHDDLLVRAHRRDRGEGVVAAQVAHGGAHGR